MRVANKIMTRKKTTVPSEMITPEMRKAGVNEDTVLLTREEMIADLGIEKVKEIEKEALDTGGVVYEGEISVYGPDKRLVRTYTLELHGKNYVELARQFAIKIKGEVK